MNMLFVCRWRVCVVLMLTAMGVMPLAHAAGDQPTRATPYKVVASIAPLAMVAREIFPEQVQVSVLLQANQNPHHTAFTPSQARQLADADLVIWLGPRSEPRLAALLARYPRQHIAFEQLPDITLHYYEEAQAHEHHGHDDHDHDRAADPASFDLHLWLSPHNITRLAAALAALPDEPGHPGLGAPEQRHERWQAFSAELDHWLVTRRTQAAALKQQHWLTGHNPWGYLVEALALPAPLQVSLQPETGIGARRFVTLQQQVQARQIACMVLEPEASQALLEKLCPDCRQVRLDPLGRDAGAMRYITFIDRLAESLMGCLAGSTH